MRRRVTDQEREKFVARPRSRSGLLTERAGKKASWHVPPPGRELAGYRVNVWWIDLRGRPPRTSVLMTTLSAEEIARANKFASAANSRRYLIAHFALRDILGRHTGLAASEIILAHEGSGRPYLSVPSAGSLHFTLSRSPRFALVAVAAGLKIGVDLEAEKPWVNVELLLTHCFRCPDDRVRVAALPANRRRRALLSAWCCSEALTKATGIGLSGRPDLRLAPPAERPRRWLPLDDRWSQHQLPPIAGHVAVLVVDSPSAFPVGHWKWSGPSA